MPDQAPDQLNRSPDPHWVLPFASSLSEPCQQAWSHLSRPDALPHLRQLIGSMVEVERLEGDEYALSMPHERVLAASMGWPDRDGLMPWAAWWAAQDHVALPPGQPWGLLSPGHWLMGRDHLTLLDPATLGLQEAQSRALFDAIRPLFEDDGWSLQWGHALRWYAAHPTLADLPTASLERVIGRNPDVWLTDHPHARTIRRLQSEVQMLLYQHPVNDEREAQGLATVNSFWLSGCGAPPSVTALPGHIRLLPELRAPMLADDMPAWLAAWAHIDATVLKDLCEALDTGQVLKLTLCGERHALTLAPSAAGSTWTGRLWRSLRRLASSGSATDPVALLQSL